MNIGIISDFNIAGIPTYLMRAINKYTHHNARCIIAYDDSFAYDKDLILKNGNEWKQDSCQEATEWIKKCDFFHFGRGVFNWPGIDFNTILNRENCCVEYYGSELRNNYESIARWHEQTGISAITGTDWTITGHLPNSFYHLGQYFTKYSDMEPNEIPYGDYLMENGNLRIACSSAGSSLKGYPMVEQAITELQKENIPIELEIIMGMSNKEALERKQACHATFTSLHGGWGISGVESMFLGHTIFSCLDPFVMSLYPDNPTIVINENNLKDHLRSRSLDHTSWMARRRETREFAIKNFNTKTILKRYLYLWDLIQNKINYMNGYKIPRHIYNNF